MPKLSKILERLSNEIKNNCEIVLEAKYIIEEKRADVVLIGTYNQKNVIIIIENKRWSQIEKYKPLGKDCVWDYYNNKMTVHPSRQVSHYKNTLSYTNKYVQDKNVEIYSIVYMQNALIKEKNQKLGVFDEKYNQLILESPIFTGDEENELISFISNHINGGKIGMAEDIYLSDIQYSKEYTNILKNLFGNKDGLKTLLDENQMTLFEEISLYVNSAKQKAMEQNVNLLNHNQKIVFIIEGMPGTEKNFRCYCIACMDVSK